MSPDLLNVLPGHYEIRRIIVITSLPLEGTEAWFQVRQAVGHPCLLKMTEQ